MPNTEPKPKHRPLSEIAKEISKDTMSGKWSQKSAAYAMPYIQAMRTLDQITDEYYMDSGYEIVARFLCNASSWRGEDARRIKKELNKILSDFNKSRR